MEHALGNSFSPTARVGSRFSTACQKVGGVTSASPSQLFLFFVQVELDKGAGLALALKWLRRVGNPFVRRVVGYRKKFVGRMQTLNYFDDQPAFKKDRRLALAYLR